MEVYAGKMAAPDSRLKKSKRAQLAVFVIIAIAIVAVLLVLFMPNIKNIFKVAPPDVELSTCMQESVQEALGFVLLRGGSAKPELYYNYDGKPVDYLCYTRDYYVTCINQKPLLKQGIEREVEAYSRQGVKACIEDLKNRLKSKGYSVEASGSEAVDITIVPDRVSISADLSLKIQRDSETKVYEKFVSDFSSNAYDMIMIGVSIINWEITYGDAAPENFMAYYPELQIEKKKQPDGTTIYIITDTNTREVFVFASRSLVLPPGYAA